MTDHSSPTIVPTDQSTDPAHLLVKVLGALNMASDRLRSELAKQLQISSVDLRAMYVISIFPDVTPKDLATRLDLTSGSVTTLLDRLEAKHYVERLNHPQDRRSLLLRLTPSGDHARQWAIDHYDQAVSSVLSDLADTDHDTVARFLRTTDSALHAAADRVHASAPPTPSRGR